MTAAPSPADPTDATEATGSPVVTVVIPAYNSGEVVREAVDAALAQTLTDLEILVVDDGSTTAPVPDDLPEDPRIVVDRRPVNGGYARVTNHAVSRARGRWVYFLDSDDLIDPPYLETLVAAGEAAGADAVFAPTLCVRDGAVLGPLGWKPPGPTSTGVEAMRAVLREELVGSQHLLLRAPRPEAPEGLTYGDYATVLRHLSHSDVVAYVDSPPYLYTIHEASETGSLSPSVWGLVELADVVEPLIRETFPAAEAEVLVADLHRHTITQMLHKAARSREDTPLRREVTAWCRRRISLGGALSLLRHGHRREAATWVLAWVSPTLHRRAYQAYDARKG